MLTQFDTELYPNDCEVVEILPHGQFVYLIQKNGSSSLRREVRDKNLKVYTNDDIFNLDTIDVYIRNPKQRYISGVNTFVQQLQRDYPDLDPKTCLWFSSRYNFLNRHYLPQFHWILNLSRFINPNTKLRLRNFEQFGSITLQNRDAGITKPTEEFVSTLLNNTNENIKLWWFIDQMLLDLSGQNLTFDQIINYVKSHPSLAYDIFSKRFQEIAQIILS